MDPKRRQRMTRRPDPDDSSRLTADLHRLYEPRGGIPDNVRDEIHHQARTGLSDLSRTRRWGGLALVATAAAIIFGVQLVLQQMADSTNRRSAKETTAPTPIVAQREDIDGNGRVDILDAFALARRVDAASPLNPTWDINADGRIDRKDVDAVAQTAVQLNGGA